MAHGDLRDFLTIHNPRFRALRERAEVQPAEVAREAVAELQLAMEELRVTEEELRIQNEMLSESQQVLHAERERYRAIFAHFPEPCVITDAVGLIRDANPAAARLLAVREGHLKGKPLAVYVAEEARKEFRRRLLARFEGDEDREWTLALQPRGALPVRTRVLVAPVGGGFDAFGLVWTFRGVAEGPAAGGPAGAESALLAAVVDAAPFPLLALDLDGTVMRVGRAAQARFGWGSEELAGRVPPLAAEDEEGWLRPEREMEPVAALATRADGGVERVRVVAAPLGDPRAPLGTLLTLTPEAEAGNAAAREVAPARGAAAAVDPRVVLPEAWKDAPLEDWLRAGVSAALHLGYVHPGSRLPSIREAAAATGADHRAVAAAFRTLSGEGVLEVRLRQGAFVADPGEGAGPELAEGAEWLAGMLAGAADQRIRVERLPDLVRRWTASTRVRCACLESVEDERVALVEEMSGQWGMDAFPVAAPAAVRARRRGEPAFPEELRGAGLIVTTPFHAPLARGAGRALGIPVVVVTAGHEMVRSVEERLAAGPLTAVAADPAYGARLRAFRGAARLRVIAADDAASLAALDPAEPVLLTLAARRRVPDARFRMLVPFSEFLSRDAAPRIAAVLVERNLAAARHAG